MTRWRLLVLLVLLAGLAAGPAGAASQQPLALNEMVDLSDEIVVGKVISETSRWEGRLIVTVATVAVEETIKGTGAPMLEITQLGGTAVHPQSGLAMTMTASTQVSLKPGEDVLLFVHRTSAGRRQLVGGGQGRLVIRENPATQVREIPVGPKRLDVLRGEERDTLRTAVMTLDAMRERIRATMRPPTEQDPRRD